MNKKLLTKLGIVLAVLLIAGFVFYKYFPKIWGDILFPLDYQDQIIKYSKEFNVDPTLMAGVIYSESHFNKDAVSRAGARGLMQIMPPTGASIASRIGDNSYTPDKLFDPDTNIRYGAWYLRYLLDNYSGNVNASLAGYNGGGAVGDRYIISREAGIPLETQGYIRSVNFATNMYDQLYGDTLRGTVKENVAEKLKVKQPEPTIYQKMINYFKDTIRGK